MPIDQFKTQVLLLHSEQSTLDNLSSGFGDRFTVHCATTGSEALNTLVDTPINVIISAQDLPGMSGLEALREARKRSPETIGILLAGSDEAVVGDEEVFQVVRGKVTSDSLQQLVDNATRQMRLMALAESANDTAANPDEPAAEHIVMETADNGSTIISGATGRLPALDPNAIATASGSRSVDVLVLTKDRDFLDTVKDAARGMHEVHYANTLAEADDAIRKHKIGVSIVDAAMVGDKVEQLTVHLRKGSARLVPIVAGRRDDGEMLMDLINRGKVYRFLLKPVSPGRARLAIEASVKYHLEAPDAAFARKGKDKTATAKEPARPAAKPAAKPASAPKVPPKPRAAIKEPAPDRLSGAFDGDDSSFTETVAGLIDSVADKFKREQPVPADAAKGKEGPAETGGAVLNPKLIGIGVAALAFVALGAFWLFGGSETPETDAATEQAETPTAEPERVVEEPQTEPPAADTNALLEEARLARDAGQVFNPVGNSAIELFAQALAADPQNDLLATEFAATIEQALGMAETAMLEGRTDDAAAALQRVGDADRDNARLPFLTAQLNQTQLRGRLDEARAAIRESRFEDAASAISAARGLGAADGNEIDSVAAELETALNEQQLDEVLAKANARMESGDLLTPANDNARYYYQLVLSQDAGNAAAAQGLSTIVSKLALQARTAIDAGNLNEAEDLLADARGIDPANAEVAAAAEAIVNRRAAIAEGRRRQEEAQREAERQAAERQAELERQQIEAEERRQAELTEQQQAEEPAASADAVAEDVGNSPAEESEANAEAGAADDTVGAGADVAADATPGQPEPAAKQAPTQEPVAAKPQAVAEQTPAAVSSLNRIRYVAPKYPRTAQRRNQSGWVDVVFTVAIDGTVKNIEIVSSEPGDVFVNSAIRAVEKWEFEPVIENGVAIEKRAGVRMMFALE